MKEERDREDVLEDIAVVAHKIYQHGESFKTRDELRELLEELGYVFDD